MVGWLNSLRSSELVRHAFGFRWIRRRLTSQCNAFPKHADYVGRASRRYRTWAVYILNQPQPPMSRPAFLITNHHSPFPAFPALPRL
jgi:hypothetical protein